MPDYDTLAGVDPLAGLIASALAESELSVGVYDPQDVLRWHNAAFARRFLRNVRQPTSFADLIRQNHALRSGVKIDSGDVELFLSQVLLRRRSKPYRAFEADLIDGEWLWMTETLTSTGWLVSIASVITSLKQSERTLRQARDHALLAAQTDALTGAPNRRSIMERAEALLEQRPRRALSLVTIDLDRFKQVNDCFGHDAGDEVLRHFAQHCLGMLRQSDCFGRMGGEEFLWVLPGSQGADAVGASERLRRRLAPVQLRGQQLAYTFSAGVAEVRAHENLGDLLRRADRALYAAKNAGRSCTVEDTGT